MADAAEGYRWTRLATLSEPGLPADRWIGNACVTGSGKRAVVVYAPRTFTNKAELALRGGFTAVIDLTDGTVTKLPVQTSLAYYNPACGEGEQVILTQEGDEDLGRTRLLELNAATGKVGDKIEVDGQLTSAVPTEDGIVAADSGGLVRVRQGRHTAHPRPRQGRAVQGRRRQRRRCRVHGTPQRRKRSGSARDDQARQGDVPRGRGQDAGHRRF